MAIIREMDMDNFVVNLKHTVEGLISPRILVIGDLALDEMIYGDTERISREAPVLILQHTYTKYILGGASNAAHNAAALNGGKVSVIGIVGDDYQANDLRNAFKEAGINCDYVVTDKDRKTITKTRISGSCSQSVTQQIVRIDRQTHSPISIETENKIIENIEKIIADYDAVIISDYHIGTITDRIIEKVTSLAKENSIKVIVDAQRDLGRYKNIYSMTPNLPDTQKYVGFYIKTDEDFLRAGNILLEETGAENILITCGDNGMVLVEKGNKYTHIPVFNKSKVFDVTGAGDTVTAVYGLGIASGASATEAAVIGNIAAGIVIRQFGCATTSLQEIASEIPEKFSFEN